MYIDAFWCVAAAAGSELDERSLARIRRLPQTRRVEVHALGEHAPFAAGKGFLEVWRRLECAQRLVRAAGVPYRAIVGCVLITCLCADSTSPHSRLPGGGGRGQRLARHPAGEARMHRDSRVLPRAA